LSRIESTLSDFSFEELSSEEASRLKRSFQTFKAELQSKVYGEASIRVDSALDDKIENPRDLGLKKSASPKEVESGLIANVSHEIRTPLNGIIGFTDLLKESQLDKEQLNNVNAIQTASHSLLEIVNELLEYSKLEAGLEQFQKTDFNVFGLVRDVMFLCNTLVTNKNVTLTSDIGQGIPEILVGDPSKLTQVLLNVMGNAIKFVDEGVVHLRITLCEQKNDQFLLEFEIADNGIGIANDKIEGIFDSFKQAEANTFSKYGGSGLGLSIVRKIVQILGGSINVTSELGVGTTFKFTMPFEKGVENNPVKAQKGTMSSKDDIESLVGLKVLALEDNLLNQRLLEQRLKNWKCDILITDNAQHGMDFLENHNVDVILMDLRMPVMDGFEVTKLIRNSNSRRIRQIPIIALTADYTIRDVEKCNSYGINDYLLKPFSPEELLSKLIASQNHSEKSLGLEVLPQNYSPDIHPDSFVDLSQMSEDCEYDLELLEELIQLFKKNIMEFLEKAELNIRNGDSESLAFVTHKIKAGVTMVKAKGLLSIIEDIRKECNQDQIHDWKHFEFLYVRFLNEYPKVEKALDTAVRNLKES